MLHSQTYTVAADRAKLYTTSHSTKQGIESEMEPYIAAT